MLRCLGHVPSVGGPREDPEHAGEERLGIPPEELDEVAEEREVWASLLSLLLISSGE